MLIPFQAIKGQSKAKQLLAAAIKNGKTSHAYLFKGASGVGKKMAAHGLAALLNCSAPEGLAVCETCPSCKKFKSNNHPDFHLIEPMGVGIRMRQIRELQKSLAYPPFDGGTRVIILPDIHDTMRRPEVANGLLKTLEEPPENTVLILTGDEAGNILPTILSRCQVIPFTPLPLEDVAALLADVPHQQAMTLAAIAEGSPGRANHLRQKDFLSRRQTIIQTLMNTGKNSPHAVTEVYSMAQQASEFKNGEILDLLTSWLRDLVLLSSKDTQHQRLLNQDIENLSQGAKMWPGSGLMNSLAVIATARKQLQRNCNRTLVFEVLFFALLSEKW